MQSVLRVLVVEDSADDTELIVREIQRGGYSNISSLPTRLTTQVYEIEGKLEVAGRFDFAAIIADKSRNFIPVYEAVLTAILIPNLKAESPGVLINREKVDILALLGQRAKEEK